MGASVLHEDAVFPVRKAGIPINIRNTNDPEAEGTLIVESSTCQKPEYTITGIAGKKGFVAVSIDKDMMNSKSASVVKHYRHLRKTEFRSSICHPVLTP